MKNLIAISTILFISIVFSTIFVPNIYAAQAQRVTILADDSYPPYSFVENGQLKGIYIDIVKEAAKLIEPHYKIKIAAVPWKRGLQELQKGISFALLPPYKHIEERSYIWPYSVPIMRENVVAFCQKNIDLFEYITPQAMKKSEPLIIGINAGYLILNNSLEQAKNRKNIVLSENKSTSSNIMKLFYKRLDCYLNDKHSTLWELANMTKDKKIHFDNIKEALLVMSQTAHIGYTNNSTHTFIFKDDFILRMDQALSRVISSSEYHNIINRYVTIK
ncbi:amino acid ABC transporter substrate-binding protein [Colwellia sp. 75C3]|uniref:substrate-binding periplasmic protein n=1 Tax=Colwellia sp. 75C3 TaxID=888425 RepID=UPI000C3382CA|nr:transporter substrate-binding domain-containing protein [Colwellia sp. 75C3]PKG85712.1 amino acid ABC transporter substrate-binding protein [Colwellia sp. 75C3]